MEDIGDNEKGPQAVAGPPLVNSNMSEEPKQQRQEPRQGWEEVGLKRRQ